MYGSQVVVGQAKTFCNAWTVVFHEHVETGKQLEQQFTTFFTAKIQDDRSFVGVPVAEIGGVLLIARESHSSARIAVPRRFNLDDICA